MRLQAFCLAAALATGCAAAVPPAAPRPVAEASAMLLSVAGSPNGIQTAMPAYYDAAIFTINFKEQPAQAEASLIAHNGSINIIYTYETLNRPDLIAIIDAIPADGMNPLWREVHIIPLGTPQQYFSDNEVIAAADAGAIRLEVTNEIYRCSVIRQKPKL